MNCAKFGKIKCVHRCHSNTKQVFISFIGIFNEWMNKRECGWRCSSFICYAHVPIRILLCTMKAYLCPSIFKSIAIFFISINIKQFTFQCTACTFYYTYEQIHTFTRTHTAFFKCKVIVPHKTNRMIQGDFAFCAQSIRIIWLLIRLHQGNTNWVKSKWNITEAIGC